MKTILAILLLTVCFSTEIILKDGSSHKGDIISQDSTNLVLKTKYGELNLPVSEIASINYDSNKNIIEKEKVIIDKNEIIEEKSKTIDNSTNINNNIKSIKGNYLVSGANFSKVYGKFDGYDNISMKVGFNLGYLTIKNNLISGSSWSRTGWKEASNNDGLKYSGTITLDYFTGYTLFSLSNEKLLNSPLLGLQISYLMASEMCASLSYLGESNSDCTSESTFEDYDIGLLAGMLIPFSTEKDKETINLFANVYLGLTEPIDNVSAKNLNFSVLLTYKL